jgi:hypothetical protein
MCGHKSSSLVLTLIFSNLYLQQSTKIMKSHLFIGALIMCLFTSLPLFSFQNGFTGIWEFSDEDRDTFLVQIAEDHTVSSTYAKGKNTIVPKKGFWRVNGNELHILYNNGWMDILRSTKSGYNKTAFKPGETADKKGGATTVAFKTGRKTIWGPISESDFTGYWKLLDEHEKPFYLHIQADHSARSTYSDGANGLFGEKGIWRFEENRVVIVYDSGWVDIISKNGGRLSKYSYAPGQPLGGNPDNTSTVERANMEELGVKR